MTYSFWGHKSIIGHQCLVWGLIRTLIFLNLLNMIMIETYSLPKLKMRENRVLIRPHTRHWCPFMDLGPQNEWGTGLNLFGGEKNIKMLQCQKWDHFQSSTYCTYSRLRKNTVSRGLTWPHFWFLEKILQKSNRKNWGYIKISNGIITVQYYHT